MILGFGRDFVFVHTMMISEKRHHQVGPAGVELSIPAADNGKPPALPGTRGVAHLPRSPQRHPGQDRGGEHCRVQQGHLLDSSHRLPHALWQHLVLALLCHSPQVPLLLCFKSLRGQGIQTKVICFNFSLMIQSYSRIFPARRSWSAPRLTHLFRTFPTIPFTRRSIPVIKCLARVPRVFLERGQ